VAEGRPGVIVLAGDRARPLVIQGLFRPKGKEMAIRSVATDSMEEDIRTRAYELYLQRGDSESADELDDWLQAERDLTEERLEAVE
jgi:hypothetical protein